MSGRSFLAVLALTCMPALAPSRASAAEPADWRLGVTSYTFRKFTFFEAVDKTAALKVRFIEPYTGQKISGDGPETIAIGMSDAAIARVRQKVEAAGVRIVSMYVHSLPGDEPACRAALETCRKLGVETIVSEPDPKDLDLIERLCGEYNLRVALHNHAQGHSRCSGPAKCSRRVRAGGRASARADIGHWRRSGIDPVEGVRLLGPRLLSLHVKDLDRWEYAGHDVPWGTGKGRIAATLAEVRRTGADPAVFGIEYEWRPEDNYAKVAQCVEFFRKTVKELPPPR